MLLLCFWELGQTHLRGFFLESTTPDLGNASGGTYFCPSISKLMVFYLRRKGMNKTRNTIRTICEIGLFAAVGFVIDELQGILGKGIFVNGGSIGFAFIAVIIIGLRRGWLPAILTGLAIGLFDFMTGAYIIHPVQPILDYIIPYAMVAVGLIFTPLYKKAKTNKEKILALVLITTVGGLSKLLSHYLAGVIFWADQSGFAWNLTYMNPYLYSLIYNMAYILPSIILTSLILIFIQSKFSKLLDSQIEDKKAEKETRYNYGQLIMCGGIALIGLGFFVYYLIDFIKSFEQYDYGYAFEFETNGDSMVIFIAGLFVAILGIVSGIKSYKGKLDSYKTMQILALIFLNLAIYGAARFFRMNIKHKSQDFYQMWLALSIGLSILALMFSEITRKNKKAISA